VNFKLDPSCTFVWCGKAMCTDLADHTHCAHVIVMTTVYDLLWEVCLAGDMSIRGRLFDTGRIVIEFKV